MEIERLVEEDEEEEEGEIGDEMEEEEEEEEGEEQAKGRQIFDGEEVEGKEEGEMTKEATQETAALEEDHPKISENPETPSDNPPPEIRVPSAGEMSPNLKRAVRRVSSRPVSTKLSRGSSRRSSTSGLLPPWLIYHWISPKPAFLSPATQAILVVCQVPTSIVEARITFPHPIHGFLLWD